MPSRQNITVPNPGEMRNEYTNLVGKADERGHVGITNVNMKISHELKK
jgi:hypothetical protein